MFMQRKGDKNMRSVLIIKTGAAGDVVRTTPLLHLFYGWQIDWLVSRQNKELLQSDLIHGVFTEVEHLPSNKFYDLLINLEDDSDLVIRILNRTKYVRVFGSIIDKQGKLTYTEDSSEWFDMSLISNYGLQHANERKFFNRKSYQQILFNCLGSKFSGERYVLPQNFPRSELTGDIAIAPKAGERWPMKNWYHFDSLISRLSRDFRVNVLPQRTTILNHISDISNHKLVISNDSLPMHLALGLRIPTVAFFTCTSPWEIYDYGLLTKLISPKLGEYFYKRTYAVEAVNAIDMETAYEASVKALNKHAM
jgi:heptosyltransferase-2